MCFHKYGCQCKAGIWEIYTHDEHCKREAVKAAEEAAEEAVKAKKEATKSRTKAFRDFRKSMAMLLVVKPKLQFDMSGMVDELDFENLRPSVKNPKKCDATELRFRRTAMGKSRNYKKSRSDLNRA